MPRLVSFPAICTSFGKERGRVRVQSENSACIQSIQVSPLQRGTADTTCLSWWQWQWQEEPGDTFAVGSSQGTAALTVHQAPGNSLAK